MLQEIVFPPVVKRKGSFFPNITFFHHFSLMKNGQNEIFQLLRPSNFETNSKRMNDMESFYAKLMRRVGKTSRGDHQFDYPKDIIRKEEDMTSQKNKKSYWHTYTEMLKEIHESDPSYDPIPNCKDWAQRVRVT